MSQKVDNLKADIAKRLKLARAAFGKTQVGMCEATGMPLPSLKNYEGAKQIPGGEAIEMLVAVGINANWLLTGEGPMLLAELNPVPSAPQKINGDALAAIIDGILKAQPNYSADEVARNAVIWYESFMARGLITPDGIGDGGVGAAA